MTPWQDVINGLFEFAGATASCLNVLQIYKDKMVRGVSLPATALFSLWGFWNLYYYPHLGQWASFAGGVSIVAINTIYVGQMIYYGKFQKSLGSASGGVVG